LAFALSVTTASAQSQEPPPDGAFFIGSAFLTLFLFPLRVGTCVGTQILAASWYAATYDVAGNFEGGTNGREIGEVARGGCRFPWVVTPAAVKRDYSE
jgi:hypothetical protein